MLFDWICWHFSSFLFAVFDLYFLCVHKRYCIIKISINDFLRSWTRHAFKTALIDSVRLSKPWFITSLWKELLDSKQLRIHQFKIYIIMSRVSVHLMNANPVSTLVLLCFWSPSTPDSWQGRWELWESTNQKEHSACPKGALKFSTDLTLFLSEQLSGKGIVPKSETEMCWQQKKKFCCLIRFFVMCLQQPFTFSLL